MAAGCPLLADLAFAAALALCAGVAILLLADLYLIAVHLGKAHREIASERATLRTPQPASDATSSLCVQLPVFNEPQVGAAIDSLCGLRWPHGRLEILVLDDSIDDSRDIAAAQIALWQSRGVDIRHCPRTHRRDYKAGALADAFDQTAAPYIAIFDVDYRPERDFLIEVMAPLLAQPRAAFVQARLDYRNREHNLLTRAQAMGLDAYFAFEQAGRAWAGIPTPSNGTGAVWRRAAIEEAGGWSGESLLEDLDLSLRAFAKGWVAINLVTVAVVGELPETRAALVSQRRRWALGTGQSARALSWHLLRRMHLDRAAVFSLLSLQHASLAILLLGAGLAALASQEMAALEAFAATLALVVGLKSAGAALAQRAIGGPLRWTFVVDLAAMWLMEAALLPIRAKALVQGLAGSRAEPFARTPKTG
jgi:cellulose synthase/poly-beta-1,6-N-acetylglucosamine synthase-like glycosyltransferase